MSRCSLLGFVLPALLVHSVIADEMPLRAPVRVLPAETEPMPNEGTPPAPARPAPPQRGTLPQYRDSVRSATSGSTALRFLLPLSQRVLLVEFRILVDQQPHQTLRDRRVEGLLAGIATDKAQSADDNSLPARLRRYAEATQQQPTADEVYWLLHNWADGPTELVLGENFEWVRAGQSPLPLVLDRDDDGRISAAELAKLEERLLQLDSDRNGVVAYEELFTAADGLSRGGRTHQFAAQPTTLIPVSELGRTQAYRSLAKRFPPAESADGTPSPLALIDPNADGQVDETERASLSTAPPDLSVAVRFDSHDPQQSRIEVLVQGTLAAAQTPTIQTATVTIPLTGARLELSAVQLSGTNASDQISLGAVSDGYPLLPEIDANEDGRLTVRELRSAATVLQQFDHNQDGDLSANEIVPTIRLAVGLGPIVHQHLSTLRSVHPPQAPSTISPPDWFARMDKNRDNDLTRGEFLGTDEQFRQMDADHDELISSAEGAQGQN